MSKQLAAAQNRYYAAEMSLIRWQKQTRRYLFDNDWTKFEKAEPRLRAAEKRFQEAARALAAAEAGA